MNDSELATAAAMRIGSTLNGKYTLERLLGIGGMAAVYAGRHRNRNRVAVKVLHRFEAVMESVRARFLREGYVANTVDHPGVVRVLDDDITADHCPFLVMELLEGQTLEARWVSMGKLPIDEVTRYAHQLLDVLAAAHDKGIVHRDIKPENVFLTNDGQLKVLDFGIARLHEETHAATKTASGAFMGTPAFMAPEQALGRAELIDARTDIYAVGATMFTLLSGKFVVEASTVGEMVVRTATVRARSLAAVAPELPPGLVAVVDRAIAFEREARWQHARDMRDALVRAEASGFREIPAHTLVAASPARLGDAGPKTTAPAVAAPSTPSLVGATSTHRARAARKTTALAAGVAVVATLVAAGVIVRSAANRRATRDVTVSATATLAASERPPPMDLPPLVAEPPATGGPVPTADLASPTASASTALHPVAHPRRATPAASASATATATASATAAPPASARPAPPDYDPLSHQ